MMKAYLDTLNGKGGINGKQVKLVILDDQAEPSKAAANTANSASRPTTLGAASRAGMGGPSLAARI